MPRAWALIVFDVPDSLGGLLARHRFQQTRKNPKNWWRTFDPAATDAHAEAERARDEFRAAGLSGRWKKVDIKPNPQHRAVRSAKGFGSALNATPIAGSWRRRARRK